MADRQKKVDAGKKKFLKLRTRKKNSVPSTPITTTGNAAKSSKESDATPTSSVPILPEKESTGGNVKRLSVTIEHSNVQNSPAAIAATPAYRDLLESYQVGGSAGSTRNNTPVPEAYVPSIVQAVNPDSLPSLSKNLTSDDAVLSVPPIVVSEDTDILSRETQLAMESHRTATSSMLDLYQDSKILSSSNDVQPMTVDITSATVAATSVRKPDPTLVQIKTADVSFQPTATKPESTLERIIARVEPVENMPSNVVPVFLADSKQSSLLDMYDEKPSVETAALSHKKYFAANPNRQSSVLDMYHDTVTNEEPAIPHLKSTFATDPVRQSSVLDMYHEKLNMEKAEIPQKLTLATDPIRQSSVLDMHHKKPSIEKAQKYSLVTDPIQQSSVLDMYHEKPSIEKARKSNLATDPIRQSSVLDMYHEKPCEKETSPQNLVHQKPSKQLENNPSPLKTEILSNPSPLSPKNNSVSLLAKKSIARPPFPPIFRQPSSDLYQNPSEENLLASYYCLPIPSEPQSTKRGTDTDSSRNRTLAAVIPVQIVHEGKRPVPVTIDMDAETKEKNAGSVEAKEKQENILRDGIGPRDGQDKIVQQDELEKSLEIALMAFRKEKTDREMLERVVEENVTAMNESLDRFMAEKESLQFENVSLKRKLGEAMNRLEIFEKEKTETGREISERTREGQEGFRSRARSVGIVTRKESPTAGMSEIRSLDQKTSSDPSVTKETSRGECTRCESMRNELRMKHLDFTDSEKGRILLERKVEALMNEKEEIRIQSAAKFRFLSNRIQDLESEKIAVTVGSAISVSREKEPTTYEEEINNLRQRIEEMNEERKRECTAYESRIMELDLQVSRLIRLNETFDQDRGKTRAKEIERLNQVQRERDELHGKEKQAYERRLSVLETNSDSRMKSRERRSTVSGSEDENLIDGLEREIERLNACNSDLKIRVRECERIISKGDLSSRSEDASSSSTSPTSNRGEFTNTSRSHLVKLILELTSINRDLSAKYHALRKQINRVPTTPTVYQTYNDPPLPNASPSSVSLLTT